MASGIDSYRQVGASGIAEQASPHQLIDAMMQTTLDRLSAARGHMERGEVGPKNEQMTKALGLIEGLQINLDREQGGDVASNLNDLYDYMSRRLLEANLADSLPKLDEVTGLMKELHLAWIQIDPGEQKAL